MTCDAARHPVTADCTPVQPGRPDCRLEGPTLYLLQMPYGGTRLLAAAFRSIGFDCWPTSDSDERTLELGGKYTSGEECYPQKIALGDYLSWSTT